MKKQPAKPTPWGATTLERGGAKNPDSDPLNPLGKAWQWAHARAEANRLKEAIKAHRAATLTGLLGKAEQDAVDRALWQAAGLEENP